MERGILKHQSTQKILNLQNWIGTILRDIRIKALKILRLEKMIWLFYAVQIIQRIKEIEFQNLQQIIILFTL